MNDERQHELSQTGRERKAQMLAELTPSVSRAAKARRVRSGVLATASMLGLVALGVLIRPGAHKNDIIPDEIIAVDDKPSDQEAMPRVQIVRTDPSVLNRFKPTTTTQRDRIERITDDELIFVLTEMGRPAGIIHAQGRVWLTAAVTDQELGLPPAPNRSNNG